MMSSVKLHLALLITGTILSVVQLNAAEQKVGGKDAELAPLPPHLVDMQVQALRVGGDEKKQYFLIRRPAEPPKEGWRTLFVLPGGSGGADFQTFVTAMTKFALPDGYQTVQLIAPVWDAKQAQDMVWPTDKLKTASVKFSTRDFFLALRAEMEKSQRIDPRYVFTLTWSSSGPNGYLLSLDPKAGITGSFIAMSVFQPAQLPSLQTAKGRPYFLYHSPADFIPFAQAEAARDALRKAGATVELASYPGGHGWTGETMADIRKGITWLEQHVAPAPAK